MERLTIKRDEKNVFQSMYYAECKEYADGCGVISCSFDCPCEIEQALFDRLGTIEEILGDGYDLDRLRELVEADRDGRCVVLPAGGHTEKDGENALKSAMNTCLYHNNPVTRYIADAVAEKLTREADKSALKGAQHG